jgi:hypothetical protein
MISNVVTAVVTAVVLGILGFFAGVFEKGAEAISEDQIEAVLKRVMITDAGKTYAETLVEVNGTLIAIDTKVSIIQKDVGSLEEILFDLASD